MTIPFVELLKRELPELCSDQDLIRVGLFNNPQSILARRRRGLSPPFFQFGKRIRYQKVDVISWVERAYRTSAEEKGGGG